MATIRGSGIIVGALALSASILVLPSRCQSQVGVAKPTIAASAAQTAIPPAVTAPTAKKTFKQRVKALVEKLTPDRIKRDREFKEASAQFPDFCKHWEQNLHDREVDNLAKLNFSQKDGFETATYTGYGKIMGCESHQSKDGYAIGKLSYEEFVYYLVGKTKEDARAAAPKPILDTHTTEIFRWENNKWFY